MHEGKRNYFFGLDLVRFAAALMVSLFHIGFTSWSRPESFGNRFWQHSYQFPDLASWTWSGWVGVQIFFVISGLVIANSAEGATPGQFAASRFLRLYPAAWICVSATWIVASLVNFPPSAKVLIVSYALVPTGPFIDGQYWTLGVEIVFYACVWLMLRLFSFSKINWLAAGLVAGGLISVAVEANSPRLGHMLEFGKGRILPFHYAHYFALGIVLRQWSVGRLTPWLAAIGAVALTLSIASVFSSAAPYAFYGTIHFSRLVPVAIFVAALGMLILSLRYSRAFYRLPDRALSTFRAMGLATYPLYLLHFTIGVTMLRKLVQSGVEPHAALALTISGLVMLSLLVAQYAERWVRRLVIRLARESGLGKWRRKELKLAEEASLP